MLKRIINLLAISLLVTAYVVPPASAEILNDNEYGSIEIIDISVIENAASLFSPVGLSFNVCRGGPVYPGGILEIYYRGMHDRYASLLDFTPDRQVKPLVMNVQMTLGGGLEQIFSAEVGGAYGTEYVMLIVTRLPITDSQLETIALAPDEVEIDDLVISVAINDFTVTQPWSNPDSVVEWGESVRPSINNNILIPLDEFAIYLDYPLNQPGINPWKYMYLYPYPLFRPSIYEYGFGPFSNIWYVFPQHDTLKSNFWDYATTSWIDNGVWVIPPGGYWEGKFNVDNPYSDYYLRLLPYITSARGRYSGLQVEINGTLVQSSIDITGAIGWGEYWTTNPFNYYSLQNILRTGDNTIRLYLPDDATQDYEMQMADIVPAEVVSEELQTE